MNLKLTGEYAPHLCPETKAGDCRNRQRECQGNCCFAARINPTFRRLAPSSSDIDPTRRRASFFTLHLANRLFMNNSAATTPAKPTLRGLDWLNFLLADVQTGVGPFLAIYLAGYKWNEESVGLALTVGGIAGILMQTPAGALVDRLRSKRALIAAGIVALVAGALLIALLPTFWSVMSAQTLVGGSTS